ncbi:unnamed protein product [Penicillium palitans]
MDRTRHRTLVSNNTHLRDILLRNTQIQGTRLCRTRLRFTRIKDMLPTVCLRLRGRTALTYFPRFKHREEPIKQQLRDSEQPSLVGAAGAARSLVRDSKPPRVDGAATVLNITNIAFLFQPHHKLKPSCPRTPRTLVF